MNDRPRRIYVVHDERGRILGIAPIAMEQVNEGVWLGYRPSSAIGPMAFYTTLDRILRSNLPARDILMNGEFILRESC